MTADEVKAAAAKVLRIERSVTGILLPDDAGRQASTTQPQN